VGRPYRRAGASTTGCDTTCWDLTRWSRARWTGGGASRHRESPGVLDARWAVGTIGSPRTGDFGEQLNNGHAAAPPSSAFDEFVVPALIVSSSSRTSLPTTRRLPNDPARPDAAFGERARACPNSATPEDRGEPNVRRPSQPRGAEERRGIAHPALDVIARSPGERRHPFESAAAQFGSPNERFHWPSAACSGRRSS
jgi:hypothetical protein